MFGARSSAADEVERRLGWLASRQNLRLGQDELHALVGALRRSLLQARARGVELPCLASTWA